LIEEGIDRVLNPLFVHTPHGFKIDYKKDIRQIKKIKLGKQFNERELNFLPERATRVPAKAWDTDPIYSN
jgi:hypothetical protein